MKNFFKRFSGESKKGIYKKHFDKWTQEECLEFITSSGFSNSCYVTYFKENEVDGPKLEAMCSVVEQNLSSDFGSPKNIKEFYYCLKHLQKRRVYDSPSFVIVRKLYCDYDSDYEDLSDTVSLLSNKKKFVTHFFEFYLLFFEFKSLYLKRQKKNLNAKKSKELDIKMSALREKLQEQYESLTGNEFSCFTNSRFYQDVIKSKSWRVVCKIIITDTFDHVSIKGNELSKQIIKVFTSPFLSLKPNKRRKFGVFKTALCLGPFFFQWKTNSLVIPKNSFREDRSLISHDIPYLSPVDFKNFKVTTERITDVLFKWNTEFFYEQERNDERKVGNCQNFVDDIFKVMKCGNEILVRGVFGKFLSKLRKTGETDMKFEPSKKFIEKFKECYECDECDGLMFKTHKELDLFLRKVLEKQPNLQETFPDTYYLLKSFDRAFWLRWIQKGKEEDLSVHEPLFDDEKKDLMCPLKNPLETNSFFVL